LKHWDFEDNYMFEPSFSAIPWEVSKCLK
jgi:hypothetical protein